MVFFYTSQLVQNSAQYFSAFKSCHLSFLGYITSNRKPSNVEEIVIEVFTKYRSLQNDNVEFRGVKLGIETL